MHNMPWELIFSPTFTLLNNLRHTIPHQHKLKSGSFSIDKNMESQNKVQQSTYGC